MAITVDDLVKSALETSRIANVAHEMYNAMVDADRANIAAGGKDGGVATSAHRKWQKAMWKEDGAWAFHKAVVLAFAHDHERGGGGQ